MDEEKKKHNTVAVVFLCVYNLYLDFYGVKQIIQVNHKSLHNKSMIDLILY